MAQLDTEEGGHRFGGGEHNTLRGSDSASTEGDGGAISAHITAACKARPRICWLW